MAIERRSHEIFQRKGCDFNRLSSEQIGKFMQALLSTACCDSVLKKLSDNCPKGRYVLTSDRLLGLCHQTVMQRFVDGRISLLGKMSGKTQKEIRITEENAESQAVHLAQRAFHSLKVLGPKSSTCGPAKTVETVDFHSLGLPSLAVESLFRIRQLGGKSTGTMFRSVA